MRFCLLLVVSGLLAAGCGSVPGAARASGSGGGIEVTGAYVADTGNPGFRPVYLTLHDTGPTADRLDAVIAPLAVSTTWTVARRVHGIGPLRPGDTVPMTLYFASGAQVSFAVPVVRGRVDDPVRVA